MAKVSPWQMQPTRILLLFTSTWREKTSWQSKSIVKSPMKLTEVKQRFGSSPFLHCLLVFLQNSTKRGKRRRSQGKTSLQIHGYKGLSFIFILSFMSHLLALDYLHTICIGVTSKILDLWFNPEFKGHDFNVGNRIDEVDREMKKIRPPEFISRAPREIKKDRKRWKGKLISFHSWLFFCMFFFLE